MLFVFIELNFYHFVHSDKFQQQAECLYISNNKISFQTTHVLLIRRSIITNLWTWRYYYFRNVQPFPTRLKYSVFFVIHAWDRREMHNERLLKNMKRPS